MRYMLLVYDCERDAPSPGKVDAVSAFLEMCAERGVLRAYDPLEEDDTATTVRVRDGEALFTDGPYAETREQLGGYFILDCRDLAEARELAALCPFAAEGGVEIRPVMAVPGITGPPADAGDVARP